MKKIFAMNEDTISSDEIEALDKDEIDNLIYDYEYNNNLREDFKSKFCGQVYLVNVNLLSPYPEQPFRSYSENELKAMSDDIKHVGILSPILTRKKGGNLQILAGHNRWRAAKLAGLDEVPVMVLDADDDRAVLVLTSTNLRQREKLLPSEKAFAYKMQMSALKRQGQRMGGTYRAASFITGQTGDDRMQIHRYIRLTELNPELLEMVDSGRIAMTAGIKLSFLPPVNQNQVLKCIKEQGATLTIKRANRMRAISECSMLDDEQITEIMLSRDNKHDTYIRIRYDKIKQYIPEGTGNEELENFLIKLLQEWRGFVK